MLNIYKIISLVTLCKYWKTYFFFKREQVFYSNQKVFFIQTENGFLHSKNNIDLSTKQPKQFSGKWILFIATTIRINGSGKILLLYKAMLLTSTSDTRWEGIMFFSPFFSLNLTCVIHLAWTIWLLLHWSRESVLISPHLE